MLYKKRLNFSSSFKVKTLKTKIRLKNAKYLLIFHDSCEEICNWKAFIDCAIAGRHLGFSTFFINPTCLTKVIWTRCWTPAPANCFLQISCDVMQVSTNIAQQGLGSELVDKYRGATSVPFGFLLTVFPPYTEDRFRFCRNTGSIPSKFYIPTSWISQIFWTMNTQNLSTPQVFLSFSHKCEILFLQSCPKEVIRIFSECIVTLPEGNLESVKNITWQFFETNFDCSLWNEPLWSK